MPAKAKESNHPLVFLFEKPPLDRMLVKALRVQSTLGVFIWGTTSRKYASQSLRVQSTLGVFIWGTTSRKDASQS